jgi:hypothetical protein
LAKNVAKSELSGVESLMLGQSSRQDNAERNKPQTMLEEGGFGKIPSVFDFALGRNWAGAGACLGIEFFSRIRST